MPEAIPMEAPVYQVDLVNEGIGIIWDTDYLAAYQMATGCLPGDDRVDPSDEERINVVDFDGTAEVPIANV